MSFAKAIEDAQKMPELPEELADQVPDLLSPGAPGGFAERVVDNVSPRKVQGIPEYNFEYNCARLIIGPVESGYANGRPVIDEQDDSQRLKEIMDMNLSAEAIVFKKETTFLKSGAVVVWIEWGTPKKPVAKTERTYLTEAELKSPESPDKDSDDSEDDA